MLRDAGLNVISAENSQATQVVVVGLTCSAPPDIVTVVPVSQVPSAVVVSSSITSF